MSIAVVGGKEAVDWDWMNSAARAGFDLRMVPAALLSTIEKMEDLDAVLIVSDAVDREIQDQAVRIAFDKGIPSMCASCEAAPFCYGDAKPLATEKI